MLSKAALALSERAYRALLAAYPASFRREYGPQMAQLFRDLCRDALRRRGPAGLAGVWVRTLWDGMVSLVSEWRNAMQENSSTRTWVGIALLVTPVLFVLVNVMQYELGIGLPFNPFDALYGQSKALDTLLDALIILGPPAVIGLNALPILRGVRLRVEAETMSIVVPRKVSRGAIALLAVSVLFAAMLFGYALVENWRCLVGIQMAC